MTHYQILEVPANASQFEIKKSFRRLAKKYHPDINPSQDAATRIRLINEAYEILSDPTSRNLYDLFLQGVPVKTEIEEMSPREKYKAEYLRKRRKQERERMEQQIHYKQKFYRNFRVVNILCFIVSIFYSFDFYMDSKEVSYPVQEVRATKRATYVTFENGRTVEVENEFYSTFRRSDTKQVRIHLTALIGVPRYVEMMQEDLKYRVRGTYLVFNNFFSGILFFFSIIVVGNKHYTDFTLSCGVISCLVFFWQIILTLPHL